MDRKEFAIFTSALKTYYPRENILPNEQAMQLWYEQLEDLPYKLAAATLKKWVATNKWSPSIADIREQALSITESGTTRDWGEAWSCVLTAIAHYGAYQEDKALEILDETTRQVVKRMGFKNICYSENIAADRANFRNIYEQVEARRKQSAQLPPKLKALIESGSFLIDVTDNINSIEG